MTLSTLEITIVAICLASAVGVALGAVKIRNISLGIGGVLFSGIIVGHLLADKNISLNAEVMHFIKEFGLILFVYAIGNQVGPNFFSALKKNGLTLNLLITLSITMAVLITIGIYKYTGIELPYVLGMMSGAVTNTPSLGAGTEALRIAGVENLEGPGLGYAVAYPFGIIGLIIAMLLIKAIFRVDIKSEEFEFAKSSNQKVNSLVFQDVEITKSFFNDKVISDITCLVEHNAVISRIKRGDKISIATPSTKVAKGDVIRIVAAPEALNKLVEAVGKKSEIELVTKAVNLHNTKVVVTNYKVLGKSIPELSLNDTYKVVVSRVTRAGIDLAPLSNLKLEFGDILHVIGEEDNIESVYPLFGNNKGHLDKAQVVPIFIGIGLGILLGALPLTFPGASVPLKLGMAGGPLLAGIIFARIGNIGPLVWFMPPSANHIIKEIGIVLFLAVVGIKSGTHFFDILLHGDGLRWMGYATIITFIPVITIGLIARKILKLNYLTITGMIAGGNTDPPALAYANSLSDTQAVSQAYATVYPLTMCLRILAPQIIVLLLM